MTDSTMYTCKRGSTPILSARNYHSWKNNITNLLAMNDSLIIQHTPNDPRYNTLAS